MATILKLDKRLETIVELCDECKCIADIGCDHGLVSAELILEEKAEKVVAGEISRECLNKAINLADKMNIVPYISFRESDGFKLITKYDKVNQAVIAGMGGQKIIEILETKPRRLFNFVLQPMSEVIELRQYLLSHKYKILVDKLVKVDDKYYNIIKVVKGKQKLSDLEVYFGLTNFRENYEVLYEYLQETKAKLLAIKGMVPKLSNQKQDLLDKVNQALSLFESQTEQTTESETSENNEKQEETEKDN